MKQQQVKREKVAATSGDVLEEQIAKLRQLFPEVVFEEKIDFDKLKATLGAATESGPGRFSFTWAGKDDAIGAIRVCHKARRTGGGPRSHRRQIPCRIRLPGAAV